MSSSASKVLETFFTPRLIVVVGASDTPNKIGHIIYKNLRSKFRGRVLPVNPKHEEVFGEKCYHSVKDIPEPVDLAIIAVPARIAVLATRECAEKGVRGAIIVSAGFKESGSFGAKLEEELKEITEKHSIRIIGPNCLGVYDTSSLIDTFFCSEEKLRRPKMGSVSLVSQSGALAMAVLDWMAYQGLGIRKCVSYGNGCDVNEVDLIQYLTYDATTKVIIVYVEGVSDGREFMKIAEEAVTKKPILVLKSGRTEKGSRAVLSHTGTLTGSDRIYEAAFKQCGIIRANSLQDLFDMSKSLSMQPPAQGHGILIVTNSGGAGVMMVDACEEYGLEVRQLPRTIIRRMKEEFPTHFITENPIDLTGDAYDTAFGTVLKEAFLGYKDIDGAILCILPQDPGITIKIADVFSEIKRKSEKPIVACCMGGEFTEEVAERIENIGIPVFPTPERAVNSMWALVRYGEILKDAHNDN